MTFVGGLLLGVLAALMLNVGKGVQKQKVHVFLQGRRMLQPPWRRDLGIWLIGLSLTGGSALPFSLGLKYSCSPSSISATTGIGLAGLAVFAVKVIGEKAGTIDALGIGCVMVGTSVLGYLGAGRAIGPRVLTDDHLWLALAVLVGAGLLVCLLARVIRRIHGIAYGCTAGMSIGVSLFLADAALVKAGGSLLGQFDNPYPYVAIVFAVTATVVTQLGFLRGRALEVVPAVNSATILTPLVLEIAIYEVFPPMHVVWFIALILIGILLLSQGAAGRASG